MEKISSVQIDIETQWRGGQRQVELLCTGLARKGHPVTLVTRPGSILGNKLKAENIDVREVKIGFEFDPLAVIKVAQIIDGIGPAVVNMHASHSHSLGVLAKRLVKSKPKFVVTRRVDFMPGKDPLNKWKYIKGPDGYIAISNAVRNILVEYGIEKNKVHIVHSGVPRSDIPKGARESLVDELGVPDEIPLIGVVASLVDHKGHRYLLDAIPSVIKEFPDTLFLIVGDGQLRSKLESQAGSLSLTNKNLRFLGHRDDVPKILGALDLFVMTSHLEGLCTSIIDAMHADVPVVATEAGGIPDLVQDKRTGLLAINKSPEDIGKKILYALAEREMMKKMSAGAKKRAAETFTDTAMVRSTLAAYQSLISS